VITAEQLATILSHWGIFAVLGSLIISTVIAITGVLPSIFVTGANIILFGIYYGILLSWLGEVIGAAVSFHLYRFGIKKRTDQAAEKYELLKKIRNSKGARAGLLIFQARLIPFIPSGIVTFVGAISSLDIRTFLFATAFGKLPSIMLETLISYDLINLNKNWLRLTVTGIALAGLFVVLRWKNNIHKI
jgi:uncharacterized membrane protein YdjX (TVP38/TMEM64 family)